MEHFKMIKEISDGRLYCADDMVKVDAGGCKNCSWCCEDMCDTISLDPYDIYALCKGLGKEYTDLIDEEYLVIGLHNLISMPHIKDRGHGCGFLTENKRCSVHDFRPGICRLFPLGRYYYDDTFSYILQTRGCTVEERDEVKVRDWLGIEDLDKYEEYVLRWHAVIKNISDFMKEPAAPGVKGKMHESFLKHFYETPYDFSKVFYPQIYERIDEWNAKEM
jgi:Fe-S-cluster containining protein